jgi:predicted dehydrogenase
MKLVSWGILGASKFALEQMGPAIHMAKGTELAAVASRDVRKISAFQNFAPTCRAISSYEELIKDPEIDVIYIPLPHHLHKEWAIRAMNAGKHVLAEKYSVSRERIRQIEVRAFEKLQIRMRELAESKGLLLQA